jgi:hypothetical protein
MTDHKPEISELDETQLDALREQLKAAVGGAGAIDLVTAHPATHTSHGDSDGWV